MSRNHHPWLLDVPAARGRSPVLAGSNNKRIASIYGFVAGGGHPFAEELADCKFSYVPLLPHLQAVQNPSTVPVVASMYHLLPVLPQIF
jgi:hypothetical protein